MIEFDFFELENGLKIYVHTDITTTLAAVNICYNVGARDESEHKTGFAHLFEHLMFGGSKNIPSYDTPLQKVGAENNAFTSNDITNYYISLPAQNIETAFWLESDRMMALSFDPQVLEVQRKVVVEEFKQRYLNQPYGDVWLKIRPLAYTTHPYRWATIGKDISHIENATMEEVRHFFYKHYLPNNAVMVVAGNVQLGQIKALAEKWFGPIAAGTISAKNLPIEPRQEQERLQTTSARVPLDSLYKAYHMPGRYDANYLAVDLYSDILGRGKASHLYEQLVKKKPIFSAISAYVLGSLDPGLMMISGQVNKGVTVEDADKHVQDVVQNLLAKGISDEEFEKVKNQAETTLAFSHVDLLNRAMALAFAANAGNVNMANEDYSNLSQIQKSSLQKEAQQVLILSNCSTLYYKSA